MTTAADEDSVSRSTCAFLNLASPPMLDFAIQFCQMTGVS
jgi:hypothetical protein